MQDQTKTDYTKLKKAELIALVNKQEKALRILQNQPTPKTRASVSSRKIKELENTNKQLKEGKEELKTEFDAVSRMYIKLKTFVEEAVTPVVKATKTEAALEAIEGKWYKLGKRSTLAALGRDAVEMAKHFPETY